MPGAQMLLGAPAGEAWRTVDLWMLAPQLMPVPPWPPGYAPAPIRFPDTLILTPGYLSSSLAQDQDWQCGWLPRAASLPLVAVPGHPPMPHSAASSAAA